MANALLRLNPNIALLLNALLFQCVWWGIILSHDASAWLFIVLYCVFHIALISAHKSLEVGFVALVTGIGVAVDLLWFSQGLMLYEGARHFPHWLIPLWLAFATTLPHSLSWLAKSKMLAAVFGALFGPLSYWAGAQFTEVSIPNPVLWALALGFFWALALPAFLHLWHRLESNSKPVNRFMGW
ncbi:DUF2878 domain-containing protein [Simiduia curdlanivorans]|uniref:DUF2878 domain-containing protein n=1 Tax=Simiduia curdlanivorans TaxID=1492769 RepID=A0ABV8V2U5_9GAMM|nr:DUF2878 domain-containing protein [Simiduia curdlanivorans]MDN3640970.1 DUF2878 domain-containing protein [Simiduia curdlanivorans]